MTIFSSKYDALQDQALVQQAKDGSQAALEALVKNHQRFIYNVALKFVRDADDASDLTQEVLIKMVTNLAQYKGKSSFRTWLYRIMANHFLKSQKRKAAAQVVSFDVYGDFLDNAYAEEDMNAEEQFQYADQITDTRNRCMTGMLLCLDQPQRLVFILGAIFQLKSATAAQLLGITAENFRQQLSRAKADLFHFMESKCGLVNPNNPCRCQKKTKGFIGAGKVDAMAKQFKAEAVEAIQSVTFQANEQLDQLMEGKYIGFFRQQPYEQGQVSASLLQSLLLDKDIQDLFRLN